MPLISEAIPNFLGGVSQRAQTQRNPTELERAVNTMAHPSFGLMKRPPTRHGATISLTPGDWPGAYSFPVELDFNQRYRVVTTDGDLKVYDLLSGLEVPVDFPDGKGYLDTDSSEPLATFRAVSVNGRTYILNRSRMIQQDTKKTPTRASECMVVVRQADYATSYTIGLGPNTQTDAIYTTPIGVTAEARNRISTEEIAENILQLLSTRYPTGYTFTRYGSAIHIRRSSAFPLTVRVRDGLANDGLLLINNTVKSVDLLPSAAPEGYVVEVSGNPETEVDNAWYEYDASTQSWLEAAKPGEPTALYAPSMPHELVSKTELLRQAKHYGTPEAPDIEATGGVMYTGAWATSLNGSAVAYQFGTFGAAMAYSNLPSVPAAATDVRVRAKFSVDCTKMYQTNIAFVRLWMNAGPASTAWTMIAEKTYSPGEYFFNEEIEGTATAIQQNYDIRMTLEYQYAPNGDDESAVLTSRVGHIYYTPLDKRQVLFPDTRIYPAGVQYTLTVAGTPYNYTPTADRTGRQMAEAFQAIIDAAVTLVASLTGSALVIDQTGTEAAPTAVWSTNYNPATTFHDPDLAFTAGELVGLPVRNLTDGSQGTVSANGATTITVTLAGGYGNNFDRDDLIEVRNLPTEFVFRRVQWDERVVGSLLLDPFPAFTGRRASSIFFHRGRLGLTAGDFVCLSEAGTPTNFFRASVAALLDSDPINVKPTKPAGTFHSAISLDDRLFLFTDAAQYELDAGGELLTPATVRMRKTTSYRSAPQAEVIELGRQAVYGYDHFGHAQVDLYGALPEATRTYEANRLTEAVPRYLAGKVKQVAGFDSARMLFVLTDDAADGVGLPGMSADPFLNIQTAVIPPSPPAPPPPQPNTSENDVVLGGMQESELLMAAEGKSDASGYTTDSRSDSETMGITENMQQAIESLGTEIVLGTQAESVTMTPTEGKSDVAYEPEVTEFQITGYGDYMVGGSPAKSRPTSVTFMFKVQYAESAVLMFRDPFGTVVAEVAVDTNPAAPTTEYTLECTALEEQGNYYATLIPYSLNGGSGYAGFTAGPLYTSEMNPGVA